MSNGSLIFIVEAIVIAVEIAVLLFLIYHIKELRKSTILAHEQIKVMREAIYETQNYIRELHDGTTLTNKKIESIRKAYDEMHRSVRKHILKKEK